MTFQYARRRGCPVEGPNPFVYDYTLAKTRWTRRYLGAAVSYTHLAVKKAKETLDAKEKALEAAREKAGFEEKDGKPYYQAVK